MKISKYKKLPDELILKIMDKINETSYRKIEKTIVPNHAISKSTIYRAIKNTQIYLDEKHTKIREYKGNVHLQIDEKYLRIKRFLNKIPLYTCCLFTDKWHVLKSINDLMRYCNINKYDRSLLLNTLKTTPKTRIINQGQSYIKTYDDI